MWNKGQQTIAPAPNLTHHLFFVNKVLLEHRQTHLFIHFPWLLLGHNSRLEELQKTV